jgi:branched-chain amino acid transport system permease protein
MVTGAQATDSGSGRVSSLTEAEKSDILRPSGLSSARRPLLIVLALVVVGLLALPLAPNMQFYYLQVIVLVFWFATLGTSWGIVGGYGGSHSVGQAAFVGVGAYTSTLLYVDHGVSPWIGMVMGMFLAGALSVVVGYPCFRLGLRGDYFTLATVAVGEVVYQVVNGVPGITKGGQGIPIPYDPGALSFQFTDRRVLYYIALILWLVSVIVSYRIRKSRLGFEMLAVRDDEPAAARGGINIMRPKLISFVVSAVIAAAAGTFYAQFFLFIDPGSVLALTLSVQIILVAALGGMNSYLGPTLGAFILVPISQILSDRLANYPGADLALYGVVLVVLMFFMPFGILGLLRNSPRWRKVIGW